MIEILDFISVACLLLGCFCNVVAGIGIFYFPDVYSRMHATGIADTLGTGLVLVGLMLHSGWDSASGKLMLILIFTLITSPTVTYVLANTVMREQGDGKTDTPDNPEQKEG